MATSGSQPTAPFYFSVIDGFDEAVRGEVGSISGLRTPDDYTLEISLVRPTGDLGYRLALPMAAPIPPHPFDLDARLGVAEGHGGDYGHFLVASGPYMFEGSEALDFSKRPLLQPGVAGLRSGTGVTLVRNPSWDPDRDPLRPAYVDRIEITNYRWRDDLDQLPLLVEEGQLDMVFDVNPAPEDVNRLLADETTEDRVFRHSSNTIRYLTINVAHPPFDDLHVRRALAMAIDETALLDLMTQAGWLGDVATHLAVDSLEEGLLEGRDPLAGGPSEAMEEMRLSDYDRDGDGRCDDARCTDVTWADIFGYFDVSGPIRLALDRIGIHLADEASVNDFPEPTDRIALVFGFDFAWTADYPNATAFFAPNFAGTQIREVTAFEQLNLNQSLLGATPAQLAEWGYEVRDVATADDRIEACVEETGLEQVRCWAELDVYMMTSIVPAVPIGTDAVVRIVSDRVVNYSFDQSTALPALDHIALAPGSN